MFSIRWKLIGLLLVMALIPPQFLFLWVNRSVQNYAADRELVDALNDTQLAANEIERQLQTADRELVFLFEMYNEQGDTPAFRAQLAATRDQIYDWSRTTQPRKRFVALELIDSPGSISPLTQNIADDKIESLRNQIAIQLQSDPKISTSVHWSPPWTTTTNQVCIWADCPMKQKKDGQRQGSEKILVASMDLTPALEYTRNARNFATILDRRGTVLFGDRQALSTTPFPGWAQFENDWINACRDDNVEWLESGERYGYGDKEAPKGYPVQQITGLPFMVYRASKLQIDERQVDLGKVDAIARAMRDEYRVHDGDLRRLEFLKKERELRIRASSIQEIAGMQREFMDRVGSQERALSPNNLRSMYDATMKTASICFVHVALPGTTMEDHVRNRELPEMTLASAVTIEEIKQVASASLYWPLVSAHCLFLAIGLLGAWGAWHFTQPLVRITQAAYELSRRVATEHSSTSADFHPIPLPVKRKDEIGALARAFSQMSKTVTESNDELSRRVKERTRDLERINDELLAQRDKAELADKAKTGFLATVSHEMKTPLHWLNGYAGQLRRTPLSDRQATCVNKLFDGIELLKGLIDDVLDYQKILLGGMAIELESIELAPFCKKLGESMETRAQERNNKLTVECDVAESFVTDPRRLGQILMNLLSNAVKFTENGEIRLKVTAQQSQGENPPCVRLDVSDTGIGISEEHLRNLFRPFEKRGSKQGNQDGTGLGLVICRELSRLLQGEVSVTSEVGRGTTFSVVLPRIQDTDGPVGDGWQAFEGKLFQHARETTKRVLIIDDDHNSTEILTDELRSAGYDIVTAEDGESGIQRAVQLRPDLITLDVLMPKMNGWEVLKQLKGDPRTQDIPVVLVTIVSDKRTGFALGASGYLSKPFQPEELRQVLEQVLGDHRGQVLVVDDDAFSRDLARDALHLSGLTIVEAKDGEEALERIAEHVPDAMLLDLNMPTMNGFELLDQLRIRDLIGAIKIIVVSGRQLTPTDRELLEGNVAGFLDKSAWDEHQLRQELRRQLQNTMTNAGTAE